MPKLDIFNWDGKLDDFSGYRLLAIMTHPKDKIHRDEYLAWMIVSAVVVKPKDAEMLWQCPDSIKRGGAKRLINAPSHSDVMVRARNSTIKASIAGLIVETIMSSHNDPKAPTVGVNGAAKMLESACQKLPYKSERIKFRTILKRWTEFKEVAHLWYAFMNKYQMKNNKISIQKNIPPLLALSEEVRKFGETLKWHPNRPPLFQRGETWIPPKDLPLPKTKKVART